MTDNCQENQNHTIEGKIFIKTKKAKSSTLRVNWLIWIVTKKIKITRILNTISLEDLYKKITRFKKIYIKS